MFKKFDFWIQTVLMFVFIPPILIDALNSIFRFEFMPMYCMFSALTALILGPFQVISAIVSLIYERKKQGVWYLICVGIYFVIVALSNATIYAYTANKLVQLFAAVVPIFLAIWYYQMTWKAYKEIS